jgi:uncharacterized membrane protein (UPF0182 family)
MSTAELAGASVPDELRDVPEVEPSSSPTRELQVVVAHLAPRSVAKVALLFSLCLWAAGLLAAIMLWLGASAFGLIDNLESFLQDVGFSGFQFVALELFAAVALGGLVLVLLGTGVAVLATMLFNLISESVGGIRATLADDRGRSTR